MDVFTTILLGLLSLDTIRAVIAMLGWVKPDAKYAWIIYGRYERNLIYYALKEMGFSQDKQSRVIRGIKKIASEIPKMTGISAKEAAIHLVILLAKYTVKFSDEIRYGEGNGSSSNYYIDTMEIAHNEDDLRKLCAIMTYLVLSRRNNRKDIIISPKGGNPIFSQRFASSIQSKLLFAKPDDDNSRITGDNSDSVEFFSINYEGSWNILNSRKMLGAIILDCNTTDGAQLLNIIGEVNRAISKNNGVINLRIQNDVFVLFCANEQDQTIDEKFKPYNVNLIRFFDLDEETKKMLFDLKEKCMRKNRFPSYLMDEDKEYANAIIEYMKDTGKYYYK